MSMFLLGVAIVAIGYPYYGALAMCMGWILACIEVDNDS